MFAPLYCAPEYIVDSDGYILSKRSGKPMKPSQNHGGYLATTIMVEGRRFTIPIHLAVARTFLGDFTQNGLQGNHKDGNKLNNHLSNLEWITPTENALHAIYVLDKNFGANHHNAKAICGYDKKTGLLKYEFESLSTGARALCGDKKFEAVKLLIWRVLSGKRKSYLGCVWKYKEHADVVE